MNIQDFIALILEDDLEEGKLRNIATILMLAASIAHSEPSLNQAQRSEWQKMNPSQKIEYVQNINSNLKMLDDKDIKDKNSLIKAIDSIYLEKDANDYPIWIATLLAEKRITKLEADQILYKIKTKNVFHSKAIANEKKFPKANLDKELYDLKTQRAFHPTNLSQLRKDQRDYKEKTLKAFHPNEDVENLIAFIIEDIKRKK